MKSSFTVSHITAQEPKDTKKEYLPKGFLDPEDHLTEFQLNRIFICNAPNN